LELRESCLSISFASHVEELHKLPEDKLKVPLLSPTVFDSLEQDTLLTLIVGPTSYPNPNRNVGS
jgi:hypothetical protein